MHIYDSLRTDHQQILSVLDTLLEYPQQSEAVQIQLFQQLATELEEHSEREARTVYAELGEHGQFRTLIDRLSKEHSTVANLVEEIGALNVMDPGWHTYLTQLRDALHKHILIEETSLFPDAEKFLGRDRY